MMGRKVNDKKYEGWWKLLSSTYSPSEPIHLCSPHVGTALEINVKE
jgi:hypothetical protein